MRLFVECVVPFPLPLVYATYRDRVVELVPHLPNIRAIEVKERRDETVNGSKVSHLINVWRGGGDIPAVARAFLSEKMLTWTDTATWDEARATCEWKIETHSFKEAVHASGSNRFVVEGEGTRVIVEGDLTIEGKKLPIPRFLAGVAAPAVEKFLVGSIQPNLTEVAKAVEKLLRSEVGKQG